MDEEIVGWWSATQNDAIAAVASATTPNNDNKEIDMKMRTTTIE